MKYARNWLVHSTCKNSKCFVKKRGKLSFSLIFSNFVLIMKIALIGAGNLATVLGHALYNAKHDIVQVYSRTMAAAKQLAERLNAVPTDDLETITNDADLYIIALKG